MASPSIRHSQRLDRVPDEREAIAPIMAVARQQPNASGVAARHEAKAVLLDLVQPARAARRLVGGCREAGLDEAGAQQHDTAS
jgi:hypothetical protein